MGKVEHQSDGLSFYVDLKTGFVNKIRLEV